MPEVTWTHPFLFELLEMIPIETDSLIDVGCGRGIVGALMRIYRSPKRLVGVDIFKPYLKFCKEFRFYDELYCLDLRETPLPFKNREFDVATCMETIEHLPKRKGEELVDELERLAKIVIISTPNRFFTQKLFDRNLFQQHLSGWKTRDFTKRGYEVRGCGPLLVHGRFIRYLSNYLKGIGHYKFPQLSAFLLARKISV